MKTTKPRISLLTLLLCILSCQTRLCISAAEPSVAANDLPRVPPTPPDKAIDTFEIKKGFKLELAAAEPLVTSPVAIAFDERGRLFVVEMRDYPDRRDDRMGRVRVLEDTDDDGVYDKATVYADGFSWPTGICCYDGGVFIVASPDIIYLQDTKGDGVADVRRTVFTGFGAGLPPEKLNVQGLPNSLTWGLDNRIHGATSSNGGRVVRAGAPPTTQPLELRGQDFSFDPRTLDIRPESGGGQHGMSFSTTGRKFVCSNSHHLQAIVYDARYAGRNPLYAMPSPLVDIAVDGPAAEVFRISPDEAWRVIRTKWRVAGLVSGPVEGGGRPSGYFTGATGVTLYTGTALGPDFIDNAFIADCGSNLVHRKLLTPDAVSFRAQRPPDEQHTEFLRSRDNWFRPVSLANGPDGALYVVDMYREIIEHPWSLPDSIKQHLDLHSGVDRGRIWRIVPEGSKRPATPRLDKATTAELVEMLGHPNGWHRETAARLLYQRRDEKAVPLLEKMLAESKSSLGRLHALYVLDAFQAVGEREVLTAMQDVDEAVRIHALRLSERLLHDASATPEFWARLNSMAVRAMPRTASAVALALSATNDKQKVRVLWALQKRCSADPWVRSAILDGVAGMEGELVNMTYGHHPSLTPPPPKFGPGELQLMCELAMIIGAAGHEDMLDAIGIEQRDRPAYFALASAYATGVRRAGGIRELRVGIVWPEIVKEAASTAMDKTSDEATRLHAITLIGTAGTAEHVPALISLLSATEPQPVQAAALAALDRSDQFFAEPLANRLPALSPRLRSEAVAVLLKRPERARVFLAIIAAGKLRADLLSPTQAVVLRSHRDPIVRALAVQVFTSPTTKRADVINDYLPALSLPGRADAGKRIYEQRCISCHRSAGQGFAVGPDFVTIKTAGKEKTLVNILDPNREVAAQYVSYVVETKSGDTLTGIIVAETAARLTVRQAYGHDTTVLRSDLKRAQSQNLSLMPEGIESGMTNQDMADLLEYIATADK
jgi:putative membrane-bound dehydrogenase-like protein